MATVGPVGQFLDAFPGEFRRWWINPFSRGATRVGAFARSALSLPAIGMAGIDRYVVDINGSDTPPVEMFARNLPIAFREDLFRPIGRGASAVVDTTKQIVTAGRLPITLGLIALILIAVFVLFGPLVRGVSSRIGALIG